MNSSGGGGGIGGKRHAGVAADSTSGLSGKTGKLRT